MFIVCGEALFDLFAAGDTPSGMRFDARIGGSPFNVALGLARLGQPVAFLGGVGTDFAGERLLRAMRDEGIDTRCVARIGAPTTLSLVGLDERGAPSYAFYGRDGADRLLRADDLATVPASARAFHFGSFAMVVEPVASVQRILVERERGRRVISYDPNVRTKVEPDLDRWRAALDWMQPRAQLLKISDEDLGLLFPGRTPQDFAAQALAAGTGCVVVTRGGEGAIGFAARATVAVPSQPVQVVDTVGAGDSFQAALLAWLAETGRIDPAAVAQLDEAAMREALTFAMRAAAITCSRRGADLPRRAELG